MKTIIAASILLASGFAQAQSFDYQKAVGSHDLFPTLTNDQAVSVSTGHGNAFAYQESVGSENLFPTLVEGTGKPVTSGGEGFAYVRSVGDEIDA